MKKLTHIFTLLVMLLSLAGFANSNDTNVAVDYVVSVGNTIELDASTGENNTYLWLHSNETSPVISISTQDFTPGIYSYTVIVTNEFGCETEAEVQVKVTAIENNNNQFSSLVYPNPSEGSVNFDLVSLPSHDYNVSVFNSAGKLVMISDSYTSESFATGSLDLSSMNPGIYFIHFSGADFQSVDKVVIQ